MNRPLTSGQAQVLRRLADNPDAPPPLDGWKASAVALQTRGLVTIARKGGQYLVTPTEAARYYREHDSYPPKLSVGPPPRQSVSKPGPPSDIVVSADQPLALLLSRRARPKPQWSRSLTLPHCSGSRTPQCDHCGSIRQRCRRTNGAA